MTYPLRLLLLLMLLSAVPAHMLASMPSAALAQTSLAPGEPARVSLFDAASWPATSLGPDDPATGYLSPISAAPQPFSHAMLRWEAAIPDGASLGLELRVSDDGDAWSAWGTVTPDDELWMPEDGPEVFWSQVIDTGVGQRFFQVRATLDPAPDGGLPVLRRIDVNTVDARFGPAHPEPTAPSAEPGLASLSRPYVISRTAWGNPDGQQSRATPAYYQVRHLVIHHTADSNSLGSGQQSWADRVRAIWSFHTFTREWGDIGYNYLIDPNGVIYEGRAGGDNAVGFHDTANYGSLGVSLIGTYATVEPRAPAVDSLVNLLAWKAEQQGINPFGSAFYYGCSRSSYCNPFNPGGVVAQIAGHRQVTPGHTTCPGDQLQSMLPAIRQRVSDRITGGAPTARLELVGVDYERQSLAAGELLKITFSVRNTGDVAIEGQAPEAPLSSGLGATYDLAESYVYDEGECFLGAAGQSYPSFPKENGRFRVMLGPSDPARLPSCLGETGGYPWRWGINGSLAPGATRQVVGYLRLRTPGPIVLRAGAIQEYVDYMDTEIGATTISVDAERTMPAPAAYDQGLRPEAHVYQLGSVPDNLLARTNDPTAAPRGTYLGSFGWDGSPRDWGEGGPLPELSERFLVEQTRAFSAPISGTYQFQLSADDAAWLWVDGNLIATDPVGNNDPLTATVELEAGVHTLGFKLFERSGTAQAGYLVQLPGQTTFGPLSDGLLIEPGDRLGGTWRSLGGLHLVAEDMGGIGVTTMRMVLNDGPWQELPGRIASLGALVDGDYTVRYMAVDAAGNRSEERSLNLRVDGSLIMHRVYMPLAQR